MAGAAARLRSVSVAFVLSAETPQPAQFAGEQMPVHEASKRPEKCLRTVVPCLSTPHVQRKGCLTRCCSFEHEATEPIERRWYYRAALCYLRFLLLRKFWHYVGRSVRRERPRVAAKR